MSRLEEALRRANAPEGRILPIHPSGQEPAPPPASPLPSSSTVSAQRPVVPSTPVPEVQRRQPRAASRATWPVTITSIEKLVVEPGIDAVSVEQYRRMAATLHQLQATRELHVVMITSALPGEGKTLTAINLSLTLSESYRRRVLLIDADLRRPSVHRVFNLPPARGLGDVQDASSTRPTALILTPHLSVIQAGKPCEDPMSLLTSEYMSRIVEEAATTFDWVIIDTPPVGLLTDANLLAAIADGTLLVINAGQTPLAAVQRAISAIGSERILGAVLNRVVATRRGHAADYAAYMQYYSSINGADAASKEPGQ